MREPKKKPLSLILFMAGLVLLPYDSVSYIIPSFYAPVSLFPFTLYWLVTALVHRRIRFSKGFLRFLAFYAFAVAGGAVFAVIRKTHPEIFLEFALTLSVGLGMLLALTTGLREYREYYGEKWQLSLMKMLANAYLLPLAVGVIELLSIQGILPGEVKTFLNRFFSGGGSLRLAITTHEASWAANEMIMAFGIYLFCLVQTKRKRYLFCLMVSVGLFVMTASAQGVGLVLIGVLFYIVALQIRLGNPKIAVRNLLLGLLGLVAAVFAVYGILIILPDGFYMKRLTRFSSLESALVSDNSVFMRVGLLACHLLMFSEHWLFGVGGGGFRIHVWDVINRYFPKAVYLDEVGAFWRGICPTSVSSYFSVFSEQGLVGVLLFGWFWISEFRNTKRIQSKTLLLFLCLLLAFPVQNGSWALLPLWLALAVLDQFGGEKEWIWGRKPENQ